jgi:predicted dehydrogenase
VDAFASLEATASPRGIGVLLEYDQAGEAAVHRRIELPSSARPAPGTLGKVRLSVIGAGSFATHEFLPLVKGMGVELRGIASQTGVRAKVLGEKLGFRYCASDAGAILADRDTDAVLVLTRHDTHAKFAAQFLAAGKHVFVEKPLALNLDELTSVRDARSASGKLVMVGFNRRYAALAQRMKASFANRTQPIVVRYLANVGRRPPEHWLHHPKEGGGVILGEGCHHLDFCCWLVDRPLAKVDVFPVRDGNTSIPVDTVHVLMRFADGSLASVLYASNGSRGFPTETVEALCGGRQVRLLDFRVLEMPGRWRLRRTRQLLAVDKGHRSQLAHFLGACAGTAPEVDVESYLESSRLAIEVSAAANAVCEPRAT